MPSVLPTITVEQRPEGIVIADAASRGCSLGFAIFMAVVWNMFACPMGLIGLVTLQRHGPPLGQTESIGIISGVIGLFLIVAIVWQALFQRRFGRAELLISTWPLHLGAETEITFRRNLRGSMKLTQVQATLICNQIEHQSDYDRERRIWAEQLAPAAIRSGSELVEATWWVGVPRDKPPSDGSVQNTIRWAMVVKLRNPYFVDTTSSFPLLVLPEMRL
jgi:hypothetical protein